MDGDRVSNFFSETSSIPFEELPTTVINGRAILDEGTNLNPKAIYDNVTIYEIPNWTRGKNKQVKIPWPGIPYVILSAKLGREVRGIVKDTNALKERKDGKYKFPNQVALDIALKDRIVNLMIFKNSIKVSGGQKAEHIVEAFIFIKAVLTALDRKNIKVFDKSPILTKVDVYMENVVFNLGYPIKKDVLRNKALESEIESPYEADAVRVLYPMGYNKAKGDPRYFNFRVLHTGNVIFSGNNRKEMKPYYEKFMEFIKTNEDCIRFY